MTAHAHRRAAPPPRLFGLGVLAGSPPPPPRGYLRTPPSPRPVRSATPPRPPGHRAMARDAGGQPQRSARGSRPPPASRSALCGASLHQLPDCLISRGEQWGPERLCLTGPQPGPQGRGADWGEEAAIRPREAGTAQGVSGECTGPLPQAGPQFITEFVRRGRK